MIINLKLKLNGKDARLRLEMILAPRGGCARGNQKPNNNQPLHNHLTRDRDSSKPWPMPVRQFSAINASAVWMIQQRESRATIWSLARRGVELADAMSVSAAPFPAPRPRSLVSGLNFSWVRIKS
jgi:hypothetical protein